VRRLQEVFENDHYLRHVHGFMSEVDVIVDLLRREDGAWLKGRVRFDAPMPNTPSEVHLANCCPSL
jgi:hypothetical protein